ncbi:unnamed protein product [Effrenium voratum]|nr:unnamed protein product [Effrenium voratum]
MPAKSGVVRAQAAADLVIPPGGSEGSSLSAQVTVEQQWVGWLLGKSGAAVRDIEASSGARIAVNQDTKAEGFSTILLSGTALQIRTAYESMTESLRRAGGALSELPASISGRSTLVPPLRQSKQAALLDAVWLLAQTLVEHAGREPLRQLLPGLSDSLGPEMAESLRSLAPDARSDRRGERGHVLDLQVDQNVVGWLLGGRGKTVQQIEEETGAKIDIDQSTKSAGYSIVHVSGSMSAVEKAEKRIQSSLAIITKENQKDGESIAMEVEQRLVGWILGKAGTVLKQIQAQSGAFVSIDQSSKDLGFSTVRINGGWQQRLAARRLIEDKILEADAAARR